MIRTVWTINPAALPPMTQEQAARLDELRRADRIINDEGQPTDAMKAWLGWANNNKGEKK